MGRFLVYFGDLVDRLAWCFFASELEEEFGSVATRSLSDNDFMMGERLHEVDGETTFCIFSGRARFGSASGRGTCFLGFPIIGSLSPRGGGSVGILHKSARVGLATAAQYTHGDQSVAERDLSPKLSSS